MATTRQYERLRHFGLKTFVRAVRLCFHSGRFYDVLKQCQKCQILLFDMDVGESRGVPWWSSKGGRGLSRSSIGGSRVLLLSPAAASGGGKVPEGDSGGSRSVGLDTRCWIPAGGRLSSGALNHRFLPSLGLGGQGARLCPGVFLSPVCLAPRILRHSCSHVNLEWDVGAEGIFSPVLLEDS